MNVGMEQVSFFFHKFNIGNDARLLLREFLNSKTEVFPKDIFKQCVDMIGNDYRALVIELNDETGQFFSYSEIHILNPLIGQILGDLLVQNEQGDKVISVYDRDRLGSMFHGARYHQTREGGSIHTDNVNVPDLWDFLYLSCISPALVGGENILVDGLSVHKKLKESFPRALKVLESPFTWEMRGVADELYRAPIITYNENEEPLFRHLRPYMESAHEKAGEPLSSEQLYAIDVLDALTNSSEFQKRYRMKKGDVLITKDAQVLHGRTCFSDDIEAVTLENYENGKGNTIKRTMERLWIKK
jgi:hypothetical protein